VQGLRVAEPVVRGALIQALTPVGRARWKAVSASPAVCHPAVAGTRVNFRPARSAAVMWPLWSRVKKPRCPFRPPLVMMYSPASPGSRPRSAGGRSGGEQDLLRRPALVRGQDVPEREQAPHRRAEPAERGRSRVSFVAPLHAGPLLSRHRAGPGVGQQVDQHLLGPQLEQVVPRGGQGGRPLRPGGQPHRLDRVNAERLNDRPERLICHQRPSSKPNLRQQVPATSPTRRHAPPG
jgi:hypothetical protein